MTLLLTSALLVLSAAATAPTIQEGPKPEPQCKEEVVRDNSHPAWKSIDDLYGRIDEAVRKKNYDALFALYGPDFRVKLLNGETWGREQTLGYLRNGFAQVKETIHTSNTVLRLVVCGDEATATVLQQWYRTQMVAGRPRRLETNGVQDERWVKTPEGWRRKYIEESKAGAAFLDGKRVDTTKPPDPEAPAYDPHDPHPKQSVADALLPIILGKGVEAALQQFKALKQSDAYYVSEAQLNALGYRLLGMKKVGEAVEILKLNAEAYPKSDNVYDSLGEAYMLNGDKELAVRNYRRAVELNPQNTNAAEMLRKLRGEDTAQ